MRFHYLFYFEAEEFEIHEGFFPKEPIKTSTAMLFFNSSLYNLENKKILSKLKEEIAKIIQDIDIIEFFKIKLDFNFVSKQFNFFVMHFISEIELYNHVGDEYLPIENKIKEILNRITSKIYKIKEINHTTRLLVNTYIAPQVREQIWRYIKTEIQNSKNMDHLFFLSSWEKFPFLFIFQHNFFCNFNEKFTKLLKKYILEELSINHAYWDILIKDYCIKGIVICHDEKIDFNKVSDLVSNRIVQHIYIVYIGISNFMRYFQEKLMNLDQILSNLNIPEFINNLKSFKINSFGEFPFLYLQKIDRILIQSRTNSVERNDPPISEIFDNPLFGYSIYDEIMRRYNLLREEINNALIILMSKNQDDKEIDENKGIIEEKEPTEQEQFIDAFTSALNSFNYKYIDPLGKSGMWADLYLVASRDDKEIRIAKVYSRALDRINKEIFESDAKKLMKINHENVIKVFNKGYFENRGTKCFFLIMEYVEGKDFKELNFPLFFEEPYIKRIKYFGQAIEGINEFRKRFELHHDLHEGNIMITDPDKYNERKIIIIDPGYSHYAYDPEDEDHDLFSIKEGLLNLFLKPEEITRITEGITLRDFEFPEIRNWITNLIEETSKEDEINVQQKSETQDLAKPEFERYNFLIRLIYLLQKHKEICNYERENIEITEEIGQLFGKLDIIQFGKVDRTKYSQTDKILGLPDHSDCDIYLELEDKYYQIIFVSVKRVHWYEILQLDSKKKFNSIAYGFIRDDISEPFKVLNNFIDYLKRKMEEFHLFPLLEGIEEKTHIMKNFFRLRKFFEYLFSEEYLNPVLNKGSNDERVISELMWIKQNENELCAKFTLFRRKDEPGQYNKIISLLKGKYLVHFRSHRMFNSSINKKDTTIEASASRKINAELYKIFEGIKSYLIENYNIIL